MADEDLEHALRELSLRFAERLPAQLDELRVLAGRLRDADTADQHPDRQAMIQILHRLAGSAGSFGFAELGRVVRRLEVFLGDDAQFAPDRRAQLLTTLDEAGRLSEHLPAATPALSDGHGELRPRREATALFVHEPARPAPGLVPALAVMGYSAEPCASLTDLMSAGRDPGHILILDLSSLDRQETLATLGLLEDTGCRASILLATREDDFALRLAAVRAGAVGQFPVPLQVTALEARLERLLARRQDAPYRIMIIDDDVALSRYYQLVMQRAGLDVVIENRPADALSALYRFRPDVLLLDVNMPDCNGPELARIIRLDESLLQTPIIYLSAETDLRLQMQALMHAGDDFLTKPIHPDALVTAVYARAQRSRLLGQAVACDSLTGLLRHNEIKMRISDELARRQRSRKPLTLVMLDIDHFKQVNDRHGHPAGDQVIRAVANLLRQRLRKTDGLGRYGGEEFALALADCDAEQAVQLLERIRQAFSELAFSSLQGHFSATFSAGIAEANDADSLASLLERADQALYAAKHAGRNRIMTG